jgi:hypothetical protein
LVTDRQRGRRRDCVPQRWPHRQPTSLLLFFVINDLGVDDIVIIG